MTRDAGPTDPAERELELRFESFGWEVIGDLASNHGRDLPDELGEACASYLDQLPAGAYSTRAPKFRDGKGSSRSIRIALLPAQWSALEDEAKHQETTLEHLVEHAAILAVAAADSD